MGKYMFTFVPGSNDSFPETLSCINVLIY